MALPSFEPRALQSFGLVRKKTLGLRAEACNFRSCGLKGLEPCARILHLYLDVQLRDRVFPVVELRRQTLEGLDLTMVGDPLLSSLRAGDRLDLVVQVINTELTGITLRTQWHSELCRCTGSLAGSLESGMVLTLEPVITSGCRPTHTSFQDRTLMGIPFAASRRFAQELVG